MLLNNKGRTIVEMITVLVILGIISAVAYPMIFMNERILNRQIKESAIRNDVRGLESFLKEDLHNCQAFEFEEDEITGLYTYRVNLCAENAVEYKKIINDKGQSEIIREYKTEKISFPDIRELKLEKTGNDRLINAQIWTCENQNDDRPCHELKVGRWEWLMKKEPADGVVEFMYNNDVVVIGAKFDFSSGVYGIYGEGASIFITGEDEFLQKKSNELKYLSNIYIKGPTHLIGSALVGLRNSGGKLVFGSSVTVSEATVLPNTGCHSERGIHGDVHIAEDLTLKGGSFCDKLYVNGNLKMLAGTLSTYGAVLRSNAYINGDFIVSGGDNYIFKDVFVNSDVDINLEHLNFKDGAKVYHSGQNKGSLSSNIIKLENENVNAEKMPEYEFPICQDQEWYDEKGYNLAGPLKRREKYIFKNDYTSEKIYGVLNTDIVIVVEEGNITIRGESAKITGVLFAPKGSVTLIGITNFEGLIIARDGVVCSATFTSKPLSDFTGEGKLFADKNDYPFKNPE